MRFTVDRLDHVVLTCADPATTASWYQRVLGMELEEAGERTALRFGGQKLNLHDAASPAKPNAARATPGSTDLCFITAVSPDDVQRHLETCQVTVEVGPVGRSGALGPMTSLYVRDPDGNLVEIASYLSPE